MSDAFERSAFSFFWPLIGGFITQIAGRLVDLRWHATHEEFEGASEQLQAHWLIWLATLFVLVVSLLAIRASLGSRERGGYLLVLGANLTYSAVAVIHFFQHLGHREVDWAHFLLVLTGVAGAVGVLWILWARLARPDDRLAAA